MKQMFYNKRINAPKYANYYEKIKLHTNNRCIHITLKLINSRIRLNDNKSALNGMKRGLKAT